MFNSGRFILAMFFMGIVVGLVFAYGLPWLWSTAIKPTLRWLVL